MDRTAAKPATQFRQSRVEIKRVVHGLGAAPKGNRMNDPTSVCEASKQRFLTESHGDRQSRRAPLRKNQENMALRAKRIDKSR